MWTSLADVLLLKRFISAPDGTLLHLLNVTLDTRDKEAIQPHLFKILKYSDFIPALTGLMSHTYRTRSALPIFRQDCLLTYLMTKYATDVIEHKHRYVDRIIKSIGSDGVPPGSDGILSLAKSYGDTIFGHSDWVPTPLRCLVIALSEVDTQNGNGRSCFDGCVDWRVWVDFLCVWQFCFHIVCMCLTI